MRKNLVYKVLSIFTLWLMVGGGLMSLLMIVPANVGAEEQIETIGESAGNTFNGPDQFVKNISLAGHGNRPWQVFIYPKNIYVANWAPNWDSHIVIINRTTHKIEGSIKGTGDNHVIAGIFEDQDIIYFTNYYGGSVTKAYISNQTVIKTFSIGSWPVARNLIVGKYIFIGKSQGGSSTSGYVKKVDTSNDQIVKTSPFQGGECSFSFDLSINKSYLYCPIGRNNTLGVYSTNDLHLIKMITITGLPGPVHTSPDGNYLWISLGNKQQISVIDTRNYTIIQNISNIWGATAFTPDNKFAFIADQVSKTVKIINTNTYEIIKTLPMKFKDFDGRRSIAISSDNSEMYVCDDQNNSLAYFINSNLEPARIIKIKPGHFLMYFINEIFY